MAPPTTQQMVLPSKISFWRMILEQGVITQQIAEHAYPGSGTEQDPYVVSWIEDDPRNPMLFKNTSKWAITSLVSIATFVVALVSSAYSGAMVEIVEYFRISEELALVGISLYVIGFAVGPLIWAPLSEIYGRRLIIFSSSFFLTAFTAGAAGARNIQTLLVLRFFAGTFGSAPMAVSGAVIADLFNPIIRGLASGLFAAAPFLGPVLGPIFGGYIAKASGGWQWVQGFLAAFSGALCLAILMFLPETYASVLLQKRAQALGKITGQVYRSKLDEKRMKPSKALTSALSRPWVLLFREPIVLLLSLYMSIVYGILYMLFAAYPIVFQNVRGWSESQGGLAFLGILVGILIAVAYIVLVFLDYRKRALKVSPGRLPPEARLPPSFPACIALPVGLFWFAWTSQPSIHWMSPVAAGVPFGFGMVMVFLPILNYLVDAYTIYAASVLAGNSMLRSVFGAVFPLFTTYMYRDLGTSWAASIPAFLAVACAPMPLLFWLYGAKIRERCHYAAQSEAFMNRVFGGPVTQIQSSTHNHGSFPRQVSCPSTNWEFQLFYHNTFLFFLRGISTHLDKMEPFKTPKPKLFIIDDIYVYFQGEKVQFMARSTKGEKKPYSLCSPCSLADVFLAEQALRQHTQRIETLQNRARALRKDLAGKYDEADQEVEEAKVRREELDYSLYRAESMLSYNLKFFHNLMRDDPGWFMRKAMVRDCSDQGGCCSRQCGCCGKRQHSVEKRGMGHCTSECWCCLSFRGFDLSEREKERRREDLRARLEDQGSPHLLSLSEWFFCPIRCPRKGFSRPGLMKRFRNVKLQ
ncbi:unnamed protein product [Penicillium olsonii]|nr:unnamed protein product [Penicillium olsonii]